MVFKEQETKPRTEADGIHRRTERQPCRMGQTGAEGLIGTCGLRHNYRAAEGMRKLARDRWKAMHMETTATKTNNLELLRKGDNIIMWLSSEQSVLSHKN